MEDDISTSEVIRHFLDRKQTFYRVNEGDEIILHYFQFKEFNFDLKLEIRKKNESFVFTFDDIDFIWYRRGNFTLRHERLEKNDPRNIDISILNKFIFNDSLNVWKDIEEILYQNIPHLNKPSDVRLSKVNNLLEASKVGLKIPFTYLSNRKKSFQNLLSKSDYITKAISQGWFTLINSQFQIGCFTNVVNKSHLDKKGEFFNVSLVQNLIQKKYELRVFHLYGKNYASCIFSQQDEQTKIDFRRYNWDDPNKVVPYNLPSEIENQINALMTKLTINSGSLDIIVDVNNDYIFLEVNPVGQFAQVSAPCQYNLEQKIANEIIKRKKRHKGHLTGF